LDHSNQIFIIKVVLDDGRVISKKIFWWKSPILGDFFLKFKSSFVSLYYK
jgi:hypothetical protein